MAWWNDDSCRKFSNIAKNCKVPESKSIISKSWHNLPKVVINCQKLSWIAKSCHKLPNVNINCQKFLKAMVNCLNLPNVVKTLPKFQNNYNWMLKCTKAENNLPKDTKS